MAGEQLIELEKWCHKAGNKQHYKDQQFEVRPSLGNNSFVQDSLDQLGAISFVDHFEVKIFFYDPDYKFIFCGTVFVKFYHVFGPVRFDLVGLCLSFGMADWTRSSLGTCDCVYRWKGDWIKNVYREEFRR